MTVKASSSLRFLLLAVVLIMSVTGCGGSSGLQAPTERPTVGALPTRATDARTPSVSVPSESVPQRPSVTLPTLSAPLLPTQNPLPIPSTPTQRPLATASVLAPPSVAAPSPSTPIPPPSSAPSSSSPWLGWLLGVLLVVAVGVTVAVSVRARRERKAWETKFAGVVAEVRWLAHEHLPDTLSRTSAAERAAIWRANRPRVEALTSRLNEAAAAAPKDRRDSVGRLRDAVNEMSYAVDSYAASGLADQGSLGVVQQSQRWVEEALKTVWLSRENTP